MTTFSFKTKLEKLLGIKISDDKVQFISLGKGEMRMIVAVNNKLIVRNFHPSYSWALNTEAYVLRELLINQDESFAKTCFYQVYTSLKDTSEVPEEFRGIFALNGSGESYEAIMICRKKYPKIDFGITDVPPSLEVGFKMKNIHSIRS